MYQHILIPLDGSPIAEQALPLAKLLSARLSSSVVLFRAVQPIGKSLHRQDAAVHADDQVKRLRSEALEYLGVIEHGFPAGTAIQREVRIGSPAATILKFAESDHIDLIVMAMRNRTGLQRWVYGSVTDQVLSGTRLPILLVPASQVPHAIASIRRILVPLDGSALADCALLPAQHFAQTFDAEILLLRVHEPSPYVQGDLTVATSRSELDDALQVMIDAYLNEKTQELHSRGIRARCEIPFGMAAESILDAAQRHAVSLIVMSTHGRAGIERLIAGSVANRVLRASRIPVLLVRSTYLSSK